jgi:N-acetyltransferase
MKEILLQDIVLQNDRVRLEPLTAAHYEALHDIAFDAELWRYTSSRILNEEEFTRYMESALNDRAKGVSYPFVVIDRASGKVAGSTRYGNISEENKRMEIGWTWYSRSFQGTGLNKACKFELLRFAFEVMGCVRIELKTSLLNERSRRAIAGIGAKQEGILRSHIINPDGTLRDTVYFSILATEWPEIKQTIFSEYGETENEAALMKHSSGDSATGV